MQHVPRINLRREFRTRQARANPYPVYARLRRLGPVLQTRDLLGKGLVLPRHAEVASVIRDPRFASDRKNGRGTSVEQWWMPSILRLLASSMVLKDPPEHRRLRSLVQKAFTPARVESLGSRIEEIAEGLLDAATRKPAIDVMADFALPLPLTVITEMLGVPERDRLRFRRDLVAAQGTAPTGRVGVIRSLPAMTRLRAFLQELVQLKRDQPGDDLVTDLVQAELEGDRLSEDELISMVFLLLFAGHETTVNLIGNGVIELCRHPDQLELLRRQPELIDSAIEEILRYTNPVGFVAPRFAAEEVEIAGVEVPRGTMVTLLIGSANLDEEAFTRADTFDITRSPNRHLAFGLGAHYCLGAPLAKLETRIGLPALLRRLEHFDLAVPPEQLRWREHIALRGVEALPLAL